MREIQAVARQGRRSRTPNLDISWLSNGLSHPRCGLVVPLHGATAVARNKLRRQLREIVRRRLLPELEPIDLVLKPRPHAYKAEFADLAVELEQWLHSH